MTDWMELIQRSQLWEVGEQFGAINQVRGENLLSRAGLKPEVRSRRPNYSSAKSQYSSSNEAFLPDSR
jgi:hypothetical protein